MIELSSHLFDTNSADLDRSLGFHVHSIEKSLLIQAQLLRPDGNHHIWGECLHQGNQSWVGLDPETLQTPYHELKDMCSLLKLTPGSMVVDLGAGYGRLALVLEALHPGVSFLGFELVKERVLEGQRIFKEQGLVNSRLLEQDLMQESFSLPKAQAYFLYDYGKVSHIRHTLNQLGQVADQKNFKLIARGKGIRSLIDFDFPWLHPIIHRNHFSLYSTSLDADYVDG